MKRFMYKSLACRLHVIGRLHGAMKTETHEANALHG
jgi:hypothetical protein